MNQMSGAKAAGSLDPSFGNDGIAALPRMTRAIAALPNNKLIVYSGESLREPITVARLTEAGDLDASFGDGGVVEVSVTGPRMLARRIIALKNGNYLIAGYEAGIDSTRRYVIRLLQDGQVDTSFGEGGMATLQVVDIKSHSIGKGARFLSNREEEVIADANFFTDDRLVVSEQSGKIYFGAHIISDKGYAGVVFRLNENGSRDTSFNGGYTLVRSTDGSSPIRLESLDVHGDGVLVGGALTDTSYNGDAYLKRFNQIGQVDTLFGKGGTVIIPNGGDGRTSVITSVSVSGNGLIVASGESMKGGASEGLIAVFNAKGSYNLIFNKGQPLYENFSLNLKFSTCVLQQDRKIIVTGSGDGYLVAARYDLNGSLDLAFGEKGWVVFHPIGTSRVRSSELTADNKIVVLEGGPTAVRYLG